MSEPDTRSDAPAPDGDDGPRELPPESALIEAPDQVLATLNKDGSRRRIRPRLSPGRHLNRRRAVAWVLLVVFMVLPHLTMNGKPVILLDVLHREFTLFGTTFVPTDTPLLMLLMLSIFLGIFLLTAIVGRAWCGWACPQTVWMEFVFRPIERLFEGDPAHQRRRDREGWDLRRALKNVTFLLISVVVGNTFLAYFVGVDRLTMWVTRPPWEHPGAFGVMAVTSVLMFLDFAWFREQTCLVACPYGRFQSVLLDRDSLIVAYDEQRGEPRGKLKSGVDGDCIDCKACVITCPTGIDIRDGLQMECIHCTQCADACDAIMDRVDRPRGLIRYSSERALEEGRVRLLRPRVLVYGVVLLGLLTTLAVGVGGREDARAVLLRGRRAPFVEMADGRIQNVLQVRLENIGEESRAFRLELLEPPGAEAVGVERAITVEGGAVRTVNLIVTAPQEVFSAGAPPVRVRVTGDDGFERVLEGRLLGPGS